jgi:hypothetical protein
VGTVAQPLQHRQGEAGGLARAGLGSCHHIATFENSRDALELNRGGHAVALARHRLHDRLAETQLSKGRRKAGVHRWGQLPGSRYRSIGGDAIARWGSAHGRFRG